MPAAEPIQRVEAKRSYRSPKEVGRRDHTSHPLERSRTEPAPGREFKAVMRERLGVPAVNSGRGIVFDTPLEVLGHLPSSLGGQLPTSSLASTPAKLSLFDLQPIEPIQVDLGLLGLKPLEGQPSHGITAALPTIERPATLTSLPFQLGITTTAPVVDDSIADVYLTAGGSYQQIVLTLARKGEIISSEERFSARKEAQQAFRMWRSHPARAGGVLVWEFIF